jgi:hypothetical protein
VDGGLVGQCTKGEIPLYASPGSGMSRERAVVVVCIKYDRLPMKLLQVFIPGKVDEYKDADLLIVRKDCHHFRIETHRGNPTYEKAIAIEVAMMRIT